VPVSGVQAAPPIYLTAREPEALQTMAGRLAKALAAEGAPDRYNTAYTLARRRELHEHRLVVRRTGKAATRALATFAETGESQHVVAGRVLANNPQVGLLFGGNGAQWVGMGRQLLDEDKVFAETVQRVDALVQARAGWSIVAEMRAEASASRMGDTRIDQPLIFAVQVGLYHSLLAHGLQPAAMAGHSVGEVAAAHCAGVLDLEQAVHVIVARSDAQAETRGQGRMAACEIDAERARAEVAQYGGAVELACVNGPKSVTLCGDPDALNEIGEKVKAEGTPFRLLDLDYAFHNRVLDPVQDQVLSELDGVVGTQATTGFFSSVTGGELSGEQVDADYWWHNMRHPVQFYDALRAMSGAGCTLFLEISPHPIVQSYVRSTLRALGAEGQAFAAMTQRAAGAARVPAVIDELWCAGAPLDWGRIFPQQGQVVDLPTYAFQREDYWFPRTPEATGLTFRPPLGAMLGTQPVRDMPVFETEVDPELFPDLADHVVGGSVIFPAAGFLELALEAARQVFEDDRAEIETFELRRPLVLDVGRTKIVRVVYEPSGGRLRVESRTRTHDEPWSTHAEGRMTRLAHAEAPPAPSLSRLQAVRVSAAQHYAGAAALGLAYGPAFQTVREVACDADGATVELTARSDKAGGDYILDPALFDGCLQALFDVLTHHRAAVGATAAYLPQQFGRFRWFSGGAPVRADVRLDRLAARSVVATFTLLDAEARVVAVADRLRFARTELGSRAQATGKYQDFEPVALVPRLAAARPELADPASLLPDPGSAVAPELDDVAGAFAWAALVDLGAGDSGNVEDIAAQVPTDRLALLTHVFDLASQVGAIVFDEEGNWERSETQQPDPEALWRQRLAERPDALAELTALGRAGRGLPELLRGAAWETVAPSDAVRAQLSTAGPAFGPASEALCEAVIAAAAKASANRAIRVVELHAAGTPLVNRLRARLDPARVAILFASRDEEARAHVEADFGPADRVAVAAFDADRPVAEQDGLSLGDADIVVGSGVVEGYGDVALRRLTELLTPDGLLMLAERRSAGWLALTDERLLSRWIDGEERDADGWKAHLFQAGWRQPATASVAQGDLVVAQRPAARAESARLSGSWVVLLDSPAVEGALGAALADRLSAAGAEAILVQPGESYHRDGNLAAFDVTRDADWRTFWQDLARQGTRVAGAVHLLGLGRCANGADNLVDTHNLRSWTATLMVRTLSAAGLAPAPDVVALATTGLFAGHDDTAPQDGGLLGLTRVLRNENPGLPIKLIDLPAHDPARAIDALLAELAQPDGEGELLLDVGSRHGLRLRRQALPAPAAQGAEPAELDVKLSYQTGALERLHWTRGARRAPDAGEVEIRVEASGLNFRDVMFALGVLPDEAVENGFAGATVGMECAGVVTRVGEDVADFDVGDEVMAFAPGCFAGHVTTATTAVARKPKGLDAAAAATVPTVFFTVYYALARLAQLEPGERVLIHGAAGGVGQAAIQYARHVGAEIFATVGTPEKRDLVRLLGVPETHILDSRSLAFAEDIRHLTGGAGVDVVLNSLAGEAVEKNLAILRPFGRFLELGKRDFFEGTRVGLRPFRNNISYFGIDADQLMIEKPQLARRLFAQVGELFERGVFSPLPYRLYRHDEVAQAFRDMQQARHIGKLVVAPPPVSLVEETRAPAWPEAAAGKTGLRIDPEARYLVTGGLGGFGLATAQWLAEQGARRLVLVSRSGPKAKEAKQAIAELEADGVAVDARAVDVTDAASVDRLVREIDRSEAPLKGVIHAAAVFDDVMSAEMTRRQFDTVLAPKADGAWALHQATKDRALDFFVLYSSVTTAFGNPGQANYVAANAFLEALAHHRSALGLPALAVCWGPIADKGYLARNAELTEQLSDKLGAEPLTTAEALQELRHLLDAGVVRMTVAPVDWRKLYGKLPGLRTAAFGEVTAGARDGDASEAMDLRQLVQQLSPDDLQELLVDTLREEIGQVLRLPADKVDPSKSVFDLGMDSLMAVELRMSVEERLGVDVPAMALSEGISISQLAQRLRQGVTGGGEPEDPTEARVRDLAERHDVTLDAEILQRVSGNGAEAGSLTGSQKSGS
jgi:acyl transferase domain-containing protein/NADPH:quinone reductase-like Zn-dependent oxidoreductase/acyl carrier protein